MDKLLIGLNSEQQQAVTKDSGAMLVLAGAGSGKTRVLTSRIAYLIKKGVKPYEILAVTFTNKAATEMKQRLITLLGEETVKDLWVGTFHNICGRMLRYDIEKYKTKDGTTWSSNFVIFDQDDSLSLIKQAIKKEGLDEKMYVPKAIQATISMAKNKMQDAFKYATHAKDFRSERVSKIFYNYEGLLATNNALDFDDLLLTSVNLLKENEDVLKKYSMRFKHILVDEFQDTNQAQYNLINSIYSGNGTIEKRPNTSLCVVGDVDQSIYSWRGADCKLILNFQSEFPETELIKLEQNYRSTQNILETANNIIKNNNERLDKNLYSNKGKGDKIFCFEAQSELEEAHFISNKIGNYTMLGKYNCNDCVVLYRTNAQSRAIEEAFMSKKIPYKMIGGMKFYARKEIKDLIAYLKLVYNSDDSQSVKRVINVPKRSIGATTIKKMDEISVREFRPIFEILQHIDDYSEFTARVKAPVQDFVRLINSLKEKSQTMRLSEFIAQMIDDIGYLDELKEEATEEANSRIENIQEFISAAKVHEDLQLENELGEFLSQLALVSDVDSIDNEAASVTLMTLHSAKGLEYPLVFLAGLEEGIFPHSRALNDPTEMEEERRLMYVGVTRAEEVLFLSYAKRRLLYGDYKYNTPSRFLKEIPEHLLDSNVHVSNSSSSASVTQSAQMGGASRGSSNGGFGRNNTRNNYYDGKVTSTSSFGRDFIVPKPVTTNSTKINLPPKVQPVKIEEQKLTNIAPKTVIVKKAPQSVEKPKEPEKEVVKQVSSVSTVEKKVVEEPVELFEKNERVFHEKFGVGTIQDIISVGENYMYSIDFGKQGNKALDAKFAKLKKF